MPKQEQEEDKAASKYMEEGGIGEESDKAANQDDRDGQEQVHVLVCINLSFLRKPNT